MSNSIREQIILATISRAAIMRTASGFNTDIGANVNRVKMSIAETDIPITVVIPRPEQPSREYGSQILDMEILFEAKGLFGSTNASVYAELMLADLIEAFTGPEIDLPFNSGGTTEIAAGDTIAGASSSATGLVQAVTIDSGSWAGGDAAGTLTLRRKVGRFSNGENINVGAATNLATVNGAITLRSPEYLATGDLADSISYVSGGTENYPDAGETIVGTSALFLIRYPIKRGNPYAQ